MNNSQFRRLLIDTPKQQDEGQSKAHTMGPPKGMLGARKHASIAMTPRQIGRGSVQTDFARQLAERNAKAQPAKKVKSSAPKGTKLAEGYIDRTKERHNEDDNETVKKIKALEDSMKKGDIDRDTLEKLVQDITGGDVGTTHLVKGLDRKLLERVRRGEIIPESEKTENEEPVESSNMEDAFDALADEESVAIIREKKVKKGESRTSALPPSVAGVKRNRNAILEELKRQRHEAALAAAAEHEKKFPSLGTGFRRVNSKGETSRIETDDQGREVLIITGPDGQEKRKVKKQKVQDEPEPEIRHDLDDPSKPINMHNLPQPKEESEDDDIFEGVGSNYNPLADLNDDDDDSEEEGEALATKCIEEKDRKKPLREPTSLSMSSKTRDDNSTAGNAIKRDYFKSTSHNVTSDETPGVSSADAIVRAALAKVRNLDQNSTLLQNLSTDPNDVISKEARLQKRAAELAASDRDMEDMDLGFGASRFDDADEMEREGEKVKFSQWKGIGVDEDEEDTDGVKGGKKRKRGPKKKKGDKNNPDDVLRVMEQQKEKRTKTLG